jgi:signal peptidase II
MFQGFGLMLAIFAVITITCIYLLRRALSLHLRIMQFVFGLLIGGILGNLYDRVTIGHVVDFIDVHLPFYRWPAFNIADSAICIGVVSYLYLTFRLDSKKGKELNMWALPRPGSSRIDATFLLLTWDRLRSTRN